MEKWLIWCYLNAEQDALERLFKYRCVSIRGSTDPEKKVEMERLWRTGDVPILITKPSIFGFGLNWQHCHNMIFVGLSDSFEEYYQAVRRCWRFGQENPVNVYVVTADREGAVVANIERKERDFNAMLSGMIAATQEITKENIQGTGRDETEYAASVEMKLPDWLGVA